MTRTFIQTIEFTKKWDELGFDDETLRRLEIDILKKPEKYPVIQGTGGLRKARIAVENKGKSGGARACYVDFVFVQTIYFIAVYEKSEKTNLSAKERNDIKKAISILEKELGGKKNG